MASIDDDVEYTQLRKQVTNKEVKGFVYGLLGLAAIATAVVFGLGLIPAATLGGASTLAGSIGAWSGGFGPLTAGIVAGVSGVIGAGLLYTNMTRNVELDMDYAELEAKRKGKYLKEALGEAKGQDIERAKAMTAEEILEEPASTRWRDRARESQGRASPEKVRAPTDGMQAGM